MKWFRVILLNVLILSSISLLVVTFFFPSAIVWWLHGLHDPGGKNCKYLYFDLSHSSEVWEIGVTENDLLEVTILTEWCDSNDRKMGAFGRFDLPIAPSQVQLGDSLFKDANSWSVKLVSGKDTLFIDSKKVCD